MHTSHLSNFCIGQIGFWFMWISVMRSATVHLYPSRGRGKIISCKNVCCPLQMGGFANCTLSHANFNSAALSPPENVTDHTRQFWHQKCHLAIFSRGKHYKLSEHNLKKATQLSGKSKGYKLDGKRALHQCVRLSLGAAFGVHDFAPWETLPTGTKGNRSARK